MLRLSEKNNKICQTGGADISSKFEWLAGVHCVVYLVWFLKSIVRLYERYSPPTCNGIMYRATVDLHDTYRSAVGWNALLTANWLAIVISSWMVGGWRGQNIESKHCPGRHNQDWPVPGNYSTSKGNRGHDFVCLFVFSPAPAGWTWIGRCQRDDTYPVKQNRMENNKQVRTKMTSLAKNFSGVFRSLFSSSRKSVVVKQFVQLTGQWP